MDMSNNLKKEKVVDEIIWDKRVSLINNKYIIQDFFKLFSLTYLVMVLLMGTIFLSIGEIESLIPLLYIFALVIVGIAIVFLLIMVIFFGNSFNFRFTLNNQGVLCEVIEKKAKIASNVAIVAGLLTGRSGTLGAGLIAKSQESTFIPWKGLIKIVPDAKNKAISLNNSWRRVLIVYADENNYQDVLSHINTYVEVKEERISKKIKSPLPRAVFMTLLIILACIPLFLELPYPFEIDLLLPIIILCFAQATLWISSLMAYPVLAGVIFVIGTIFYTGLQPWKSSYFVYENPTTNFETLSSWEWPSMILLFISLGFLIWFSLRSIRGKQISMLEADISGDQ